MTSHVCLFSIVRLGSHYKGTAYEVNECEECGALAMLAAAGPERRLIPKQSSEFNDVVELYEYLIRALHRQ